MKCIKCKETYDDEFKFCPYCGEEKPAPKICPKCKLEPSVEFNFCPECGTQLISFSQWKELNREELNKLNEQIREYEEQGNYSEASYCIALAMTLDPSNQTYQLKIKELIRKELNKLNEQIREYEEQGNYSEALDCIFSARILDSSNQTYQLKIEKLIMKEELKEYISYWEEKQRCFNRLGRRKEAKECANKLIELRRTLKTV